MLEDRDGEGMLLKMSPSLGGTLGVEQKKNGCDDVTILTTGRRAVPPIPRLLVDPAS